MKILWIPQISSKSADGYILLNKDSNISFLLNMVESENFVSNDILVAFEFSREKCIGVEVVEKYFDVVFNSSRVFTNAKMERFNFDSEYFEQIKNQYGNFDVVFTNEPTKVQPLKVIFSESKICCYNHWLACKNMPDLSLRQFEGMKAADICFVNSAYTIQEILKYYSEFEGAQDVKLVKLQPSFSGDIKPLKQYDSEKQFAIIYNHRLSSDPYYANAFKSLLSICDEVEKYVDNMPIVYFTNPSGKQIDVESYKPYFKQINLESKENYNDFLASNVLVHLNTFFTSEGMWSMSTVDCAINGNICLLPNKYGYAEIFSKNYYGYCATESQMADKLVNLIKGISKAEWYLDNYVKNHSGKSIGDKLVAILENDEIIGCNRPWGSYEILEKSPKRVVKRLTILPHSRLSRQVHKFKTEKWVVISGTPDVYIGSKEYGLCPGDMITIPAGKEHYIQSYGKVIIIEESTSNTIVSESDIVRITDIYGR